VDNSTASGDSSPEPAFKVLEEVDIVGHIKELEAPKRRRKKKKSVEK
jgi:hypothetical protein